MNIPRKKFIKAIENLNGADGEDTQYLVEVLNMKDQLLRQLFLSADDQTISNLIEERESIVGEIPFWDGVRNTEYAIKERCRKVWDDLHNNDTLTFNNFEDYYKHINKNK